MTPSVLIGGAGATSSAGGVSAGGTWPLSVSTGQTAASAAASVGVSRPLIASGATRAGAFTNISGGFVRPSIAKRSGFARRTATVLTGRRSVRR
jgi:hypothetical protein